MVWQKFNELHTFTLKKIHCRELLLIFFYTSTCNFVANFMLLDRNVYKGKILKETI